tara:strand:- start:473 stop:940 length:468 start_codon:yes stop_codon:yes gene_type:complete
MAIEWVSSPVDDEIRSVHHFAQRARYFATQLGGDFGWTVSQRGVAVDHPTDKLRESYCRTLCFASDITEAINEWHVGFVEIVGCHVDGVLDGSWFAVDQSFGVEGFGGVVFEPRFTETAGTLCFDDAIAFSVQLHIVAHTTTEGACGVLYDLDGH